ncbi:hypothetical protein AKJ18_00745 [Vibrio xuii]|nr:hypothetical protein AKJ18_00745 [Vibrio xuii]
MKHYFILIVALLTGCSGGDGGSSSTTSTLDSNVTRYSSDYAVSDLQALFTLSATSSSDAEVTGYILDNSDLFVTLSGNDELVVTVDNIPQHLKLTKQEVVEGSGSYGGEYYELMTSALATEYRVSFVRDGVDITQLTATEFPIPFDPVVSFSNETVDVSFSPETDHTYSYTAAMLACLNSAEINIRTMSPDIISDEHLLNSGSYNKSLSEIFGQTQAELTLGYDTCTFEMDIVATKDSIPTQSNGQITLDVQQKRTVKIDL